MIRASISLLTPRFTFALIYFFKIFNQKNIGTYVAVTILSNTSGVVFSKDERPAGNYKVFSSNEIRSFYYVKKKRYILKQMFIFFEFKLNKFNNSLLSR